MDSRGNDSDSNKFTGHHARDHARQHNGNVFYIYGNYHNLRSRHSDETLWENDRNRALITAASEGQTPRVKHLLHLGAGIDHTDQYGLTTLHHAALSGFHDTVSTFLEAGADVNATSLDYGTPLHLAALKGRSSVVRLLLHSRADVSRRSGKIGTALHCAYYAGDLGVLDELYNHGADVAALDIVRLPSFYFIHTAGIISSTGWPTPSAPDLRSEYVECQPWHMAFLGNNDSFLAPVRPIALQVPLKAWEVNIVEDVSSRITSVHRAETLDVLKVLVEVDNPELLQTLLIGGISASTPLAGYNALRAGILLERVRCVRTLLEFRAIIGPEQYELEYLAKMTQNEQIRDMLLYASSTAPVLNSLLSTLVTLYPPLETALCLVALATHWNT